MVDGVNTLRRTIFFYCYKCIIRGSGQRKVIFLNDFFGIFFCSIIDMGVKNMGKKLKKKKRPLPSFFVAQSGVFLLPPGTQFGLMTQKYWSQNKH